MADLKEIQIGSTIYTIKDETARNNISALQAAVGSPLVANLAASMTDTTKIYVYTGSETGYTSGHWYYYNGSAWTDGGTYQSAGIGAGSIDGSKLSTDIKASLLNFFAHVALTDQNGQTYYDELESALYPPANLVSISAVYAQSGTVYDTDSLDVLKSDLIVTALYDDETTKIISNYTLSGELETGTSTITVAYNDKTTTFNVTVTEYVPIASVTYTQGSIPSQNTDTNRVTGVITNALHFDTETFIITVANGYSVYPFAYSASNDQSKAGTRSGANTLYVYAVSDSGYVAPSNANISGELKCNNRTISASFGWVTGTATYAFEKTGNYGYSFTGIGFLVKKDDESNITPAEAESAISFSQTE